MQSKGLVSRSWSFARCCAHCICWCSLYSTQKAQAAEYIPTISNASYTTLVGSNVRVNFDYVLNNGASAQPGDTFTIISSPELENTILLRLWVMQTEQYLLVLQLLPVTLIP